MRPFFTVILAALVACTACVKDAVYPFPGGEEADYTLLRLNEINGNDKFVELVNAGSTALSLEGVTLVKDGACVWTGPALVLEPGAFLLLYGTDVAVPGGPREGYDPLLVFHSGLSARKAFRLRLLGPDGGELDDFNLITLLRTQAPASYSRVPDGTGEWFYTAATPGAPNADSQADGPVFE